MAELGRLLPVEWLLVPLPCTRQPAGAPPVIDDNFQPGTTFEQIIELYDFDRKPKLLVLDAIERVEVAMRVRVGHTLGRHGAFAHTDPNVLSPEFVGVTSPAQPPAHAEWLDSAHAKWLRKVAQEQSRSKEEFVKHFTRKYGGPLPVWVVTERSPRTAPTRRSLRTTRTACGRAARRSGRRTPFR
ncbi:Abi family protein [Rhodococcus yananensis]|uniref:Abi family protein n=1 Tax=Rhodococcus yananensis TaxID=2879464 RepID=UPI003EBAF39A